MTLFIAGALVSLGHLPEKLNPVIKPLMESIKKEPIFQLQQLSAQKLVTLLDLCILNKMPNPAEKVTRNLIHFAYANQFPEGIFFYSGKIFYMMVIFQILRYGKNMQSIV